MVTGLLLPAILQGASIHKRPMIIAEGDSLTYGQDTRSPLRSAPINRASQPRSSTPYPEVLQAALGRCAVVENRGFPGDQSVDGLMRWKPKPSSFVIIQYGTNDALDYGGHGKRVNLASFHSALVLIARQYQNLGSSVIFISPPPVADLIKNASLRPYRNEVRKVATELQVGYIDGPGSIGSESPLWTDGVHLTGPAYTQLARSVERALIGMSGGTTINSCLQRLH